MIRAALYARYSSDLQSDRSIEDQNALCEKFAARNRFDVVATFDDRAKSGASIHGRHGLKSLLLGCKNGIFDVVVVEALDRISRDQEDLAGIFKRLQFAGIEIHAVHEGRVDQIQVGIRGLMGGLFLKDLAEKVHRGMAGVIRDGRHAGGRPYGYTPVPGQSGQLVIVEKQASVVRRIFDLYVGGVRPRQIAKLLNEEGVAPPRGKYWSASTINGNASRSYGILLNPIYGGKMVWNRVRMIKDPDTGNRLSRTNPKEEWMTADVPHLAIVSSETFSAVQVIKASRSHDHPGKQKQPKYLFSGLLKCGCCGGGMSIKDRDHGRLRIICTRFKESGCCSNSRSYYLENIEARISHSFRDKLGDPEMIQRYIEKRNDELEKLNSTQSSQIKSLADRKQAIAAKIERVTELLIDGTLDKLTGGPKIRSLRKESNDIDDEIEKLELTAPVKGFSDDAVSTYLESLGNLEGALRGPDDITTSENFAAVRDLIDQIIVHPTASKVPDVEIIGDLCPLLDKHTRAISAGGLVVAEEGLEPPTRGL